MHRIFENGMIGRNKQEVEDGLFRELVLEAAFPVLAGVWQDVCGVLLLSEFLWDCSALSLHL